MEGNTLKILTLSSFNIFGLRQYQHNRSAQCVSQNNISAVISPQLTSLLHRTLGISTLVGEILYTCHALYGKDQLYHVARGLELLKLDTEVTKTLLELWWQCRAQPQMDTTGSHCGARFIVLSSFSRPI